MTKLPRAKSKYRNVPTRGFASKREANRYDELVLLQKAGKISGLGCQAPFKLEVEGKLICTYIADFIYLEIEGHAMSPTVEDCKGLRTPIYKLKAKLMKAIHGITILET